MASIQDKIDYLTEVERRLNGGATHQATAIAADMAASIANRVINDGESADGSKFSPYSTKEVPAYFYYGRSRNAAGEAKVKAANKKKEGVSYKEFRGFNGLPVDKKNFSFSNAMWSGFGVKKVDYQPDFYTLTLGGKTQDSADKLGWMAGQEGRSIIAPNKEELTRAKDELTRYIING